MEARSNRYIEEIGMTAAQFHAGLDKLWKALEDRGIPNPDGLDVFTLAAEQIAADGVFGFGETM